MLVSESQFTIQNVSEMKLCCYGNAFRHKDGHDA